jgi:hypothetical protein
MNVSGRTVATWHTAIHLLHPSQYLPTEIHFTGCRYTNHWATSVDFWGPYRTRKRCLCGAGDGV